MIKNNSHIFHILISFSFVSCLFISGILLKGCYSFTGGSVPDHLKTLSIPTVNDQSGFGNPEYKLILTQSLIDNFKRDNSFELVESGGDARVIVSINSILEQTVAVSPGELETERRIVVNCTAEYYDFINKKSIWKKNFSNYGVFDVKNAIAGRNQAIEGALRQIADDILLAVVSGW